MEAGLMKVRDVEPGMENISLVVRVVSISRPRKVLTRYGEAAVASAVVADETGEIILNLWRGQVGLVKPGCIVKIEGAFAKEFKGRTELNVGRNGSITVLKKS